MPVNRCYGNIQLKFKFTPADNTITIELHLLLYGGFMFCGHRHIPGCDCRLCRTVRRGYVIPPGKVGRTDKEQLVITGDAMVLVRPNTKLNGDAIEPLLEDSDFTAMLPHLAEHLILTKYSDNSPRQTSTLLIFVDQGVLKLCLSDREVGRSCFVTGKTFEEALRKLDEGLKDDTVDWRTKRQQNVTAYKPPF